MGGKALLLCFIGYFIKPSFSKAIE